MQFSAVKASFVLAFALCLPLHGALIDADHLTDWPTLSGVSNGIPYYTNIHSTLTSSATVAQINTAIVNAGAAASVSSPQVILLGSGTYSLNASIEVAPDYVELRGAGMSNTVLNFTTVTRNACVYIGRNEYADFNDTTPPPHVATWHANFTRGTTTIKLSNVTGLSVGRLMGLDQLEDLNLVRNTGTEGGFHTRLQGQRGQFKLVEVTAISGTNVTFYPAIEATNWASANTPEAFWLNGDHTKFSGVSHLRINNVGAGAQQGVHFKNAANCWAYKLRAQDCSNEQIMSRFGFRNQALFCIGYGAGGGVGSYGISSVLSYGWRVECCETESVGPTFLQGSGGLGAVFFGNYQTNAFYNNGGSTEWLVEGTGTHGTHCQYMLFEANHVYNYWGDFIRGSGSDNTLFRNRIIGRGWNSNKPGTTTQNNMPIVIQSTNYFTQILGNILGDTAWHTQYEFNGATSGALDEAIFVLGYASSTLSSGHDTRVGSTMNRAFNYDTVTGGVVSNGLSAASLPISILFPNGYPATNHDGSVYWGDRPVPAFDATSPGSTLTVTEKIYTNLPSGYFHYYGTYTPVGSGGGQASDRKGSTVIKRVGGQTGGL